MAVYDEGEIIVHTVPRCERCLEPGVYVLDTKAGDFSSGGA